MKILRKRGTREKITKLGRLSLLLLIVLQYFTPFLGFIQPVKADEFYNTGGNVWECNAASVVGVQYNSIGGNGVQWNAGQVSGVSGSWIQNRSLLDVADITYPDAHKYPGMADEVAVPPNTRVEFGYWVYDYTWHDVFVDRLEFFVSRPNPADGDLTRLGSGSDGYANINANGLGTRGGKRIIANRDEWYGVRSAGGGRVFYSFDTIQPIQAQSFTASPTWSGQNLTVTYTLVVRNVSTYNVGNIRIRDVMPSGAVYDQTHSFNAGQTRTFTWSENWGTTYPETITNDGVRIWDNNTYSESPTQTRSSINDWGNPADRPAAMFRSDSNAPSGWSANQPVWGQTERPPITVRIIPYWFDYGTSNLNLPPNVVTTKTVTDSDETNVENNSAGNREDLTYTVEVRNIGGRTTDVDVTDDYDQNFINILDADGGNDNGDTITWNIPELEHNQTVTYTVQAKIIDLDHGSYTFDNVAGTEWGEDTVTTTVNARADIRLTKRVTDSDENLVQQNTIEGDHYDESERRLTFTINYENIGDADATGAVLTDNLSEFFDAGILNRVENISNSGTYDSNSHVVTWNIGDLDDGASGQVNFDIVLNRHADVDRSLLNRATMTTNENGDITTTTTTTIHTPEVVISKTDNRNTANTGDTLSYEVTINNTGTGDGFNLEITDVLPNYVTDVRNISDGGTYDSNTRTITWIDNSSNEGINLGSGENHTYTFDVTIPTLMPVGVTTLTNNATVDTPTEQPKNTDDETTVEAYPNLDIEKFIKNLTAIQDGRPYSGNGVDHPDYGADADSWNGDANDVITIAGDELEFTLVYRNTGNADSPSTFVADHLPRYITDANGNQFEIIRIEDFISVDDGITAVPNGSGWDIVWDIGTLSVGDDWLVKNFVVRVNPDSGTTYTANDTQRILNNVSEVYSQNPLVESDEDNAVFRVDQPVAHITKDSDKVIYQSNEQVIYEINVNNSGDATAVGVIRDTLPEGMSFVSSSPNASRVNGRVIEWDLTLNAGESSTIQITASFDVPVQDQQFFNNNVTYDYNDINDNSRPDVSAEAEVQVLAPVIEVVKDKLEADIVTPLNTVKYTVTMKNVGSGIGFNVNIQDSIDVELVDVLTGSISNGGTYNSSTKTITWQLGDVQPDQEITRTFTARVKFADTVQNGDVIANKVTVDSDTSATIESNTVSSEISCGYLSGTVWEDSNKNAIIEQGELRIPNTSIVVSVKDFEDQKVTFVSDGEGRYVATCLPYEKDVYVDIQRPNGYLGQTTVDNYMVNLTQSGKATIFKLDEQGNTLFVWAGGSFTNADLGLYRTRIGSGSVLGISTIMSDTGFPLIVAFILLATLSVGGYILLTDKEGKLAKERLNNLLKLKHLWIFKQA